MWGEITFAAAALCEVALCLSGEQPAKKARMSVAARVAANIVIARLDLLFIIEEKLHFLTRDDRTKFREASHRDPSAPDGSIGAESAGRKLSRALCDDPARRVETCGHLSAASHPLGDHLGER